MKTLLEAFHITLEKDMDTYDIFEKYNLIGLDFGDGEISASRIVWSHLEPMGLKTRALAFDRGISLFKSPNAYYISDKIIKLIMEVSTKDTNQKDGGARYYNFKYYPGSTEAKAFYIKDDGMPTKLKNEEVMAKGFACVIDRLFECNMILDRNKPTIVLVGRPSSPGWASSELVYSQVLKSKLPSKLPKDQAPIEVAIKAESTAALAREMDPGRGADRVRGNQIVVILDCGSSTFDITIVTPNGIPEGGEDSYQFGGNLLDANLLQYAMECFRKEYPQQVGRHGQKLDLRIKKESYYGLDGDAYDPQKYKIPLLNADGSSITGKNGRPMSYNFDIDDDCMEHVVENPDKSESMKVNVVHIVGKTGKKEHKEVRQCDSWLAGCRYTYQSFYDRMKPFFNKKNEKGMPVPDRVIMTGGVSVMPEVRKMAKEVFGIAPDAAKRPNYSVSEGLAYVLGNEILKMQYLKELEESLYEKLPSAKNLRGYAVQAGIEEDWTSFYDAVQAWAKEPEPRTLKDGFDSWSEKYFIRGYGCIRRGVKEWYEEEGIASIIQKTLKEKFESIFPDFKSQFSYQWQDPPLDAMNEVTVTISYDYKYFFGSPSEKGLDVELDTPLTQERRKQMFTCFVSRKDGIREGGAYVYSKGLFGLGIGAARYDGLKKAYETQITEEVAEEIRNEVIQLFHEPLKDHVEMITPYFNMTSRK